MRDFWVLGEGLERLKVDTPDWKLCKCDTYFYENHLLIWYLCFMLLDVSVDLWTLVLFQPTLVEKGGKSDNKSEKGQIAISKSKGPLIMVQ